jgi:hypothetical protein
MAGTPLGVVAVVSGRVPRRTGAAIDWPDLFSTAAVTAGWRPVAESLRTECTEVDDRVESGPCGGPTERASGPPVAPFVPRATPQRVNQVVARVGPAQGIREARRLEEITLDDLDARGSSKRCHPLGGRLPDECRHVVPAIDQCRNDPPTDEPRRTGD